MKKKDIFFVTVPIIVVVLGLIGYCGYLQYSFYEGLMSSLKFLKVHDELIQLYDDFIQFHDDEDKTDEAINAYKKAIETGKKIVNATVQNERYLVALGSYCDSLASLYLSSGQIEEAKESYFEGIRVYERLFKDSEYWRSHWLSKQTRLYCKIATIYLQQEEMEHAKEMCNKVLEIKFESEKHQNPDGWYKDYLQEKMQGILEQYSAIWEEPEDYDATILADMLDCLIYPQGADILIGEAIRGINTYESDERDCCKQSLKKLFDSLSISTGGAELKERIRPYIE